MSKIASSCENCIWAKSYPKAEKPRSAKEIWSEKTGWQKFWGDYTALRWEVAVLSDKHDLYLHYRKCTRFPEVVRKHKNDFCGEHTPALETMTEEELIAGLDKLNRGVK